MCLALVLERQQPYVFQIIIIFFKVLNEMLAT